MWRRRSSRSQSRAFTTRRSPVGRRSVRSWSSSRCRCRRGSPPCRARAAKACCGASLSRSATRCTRSTIPSTTSFRSGARAATSRLSTMVTVRLRELLAHLYVLVPVLDAEKHYWVGEDEVDKLLRRGEGWLASHPERDLIINRYLKYRRSLTSDALAKLLEDEEVDPDSELETRAIEEEAVEEPLRLNERRL